MRKKPPKAISERMRGICRPVIRAMDLTLLYYALPSLIRHNSKMGKEGTGGHAWPCMESRNGNAGGGRVTISKDTGWGP